MLTDAEILERGELVDQLQKRMAAIKKEGLVPPEKFSNWIDALYAAEETEAIDLIKKELAELPPIEIAAEQVTWQTYGLFYNEACKSLYDRGMHALIKTGNIPAQLKQFLEEIDSIQSQTALPSVAMELLQKQIVKMTAYFNEAKSE